MKRKLTAEGVLAQDEETDLSNIVDMRQGNKVQYRRKYPQTPIEIKQGQHL